MITINDFLTAFLQVWERELSERKDELASAYGNDTAWTNEGVAGNA